MVIRPNRLWVVEGLEIIPAEQTLIALQQGRFIDFMDIDPTDYFWGGGY